MAIKIASILEGSPTGVSSMRLLNVDSSGITTDNGSGQQWALQSDAVIDAWLAVVLSPTSTEYVCFDWEVDLAVIGGFYNGDAGITSEAARLISRAKLHAPNAKFSFYAVPFNDWFVVESDVDNGTSVYFGKVSHPNLLGLYATMDWVAPDYYDTFADGFTSSIGGDPAKDGPVHTRFVTDLLNALDSAIPSLLASKPVIPWVWHRYRDISPAVTDGYGFDCIGNTELTAHMGYIWNPTVNGVGIAGFNHFTSEQFFYQSTQNTPSSFRYQIYQAEVGINPPTTPWSPTVQNFAANKQENFFSVIDSVVAANPRAGGPSAPVFGSVSVTTGSGAGEIDIVFTTDQPGTNTLYLQASTAGEPDDAQMIAGLDANGDAAPWTFEDSTPDASNSLTATGLPAGVSHTVYALQQ